MPSPIWRTGSEEPTQSIRWLRLKRTAVIGGRRRRARRCRPRCATAGTAAAGTRASSSRRSWRWPRLFGQSIEPIRQRAALTDTDVQNRCHDFVPDTHISTLVHNNRWVSLDFQNVDGIFHQSSNLAWRQGKIRHLSEMFAFRCLGHRL